MSDHIDALAANVRHLRETHGLSLSQLGERSGVAKATLFKVERGRTNPTLETMVAIADTFGVAVQDLIKVADRATVDVVRPGEGQNISDDASIGYILRKQVIGAGTLEVHAQVFRDGKSEVSASHGAGAREHVLVRCGSIQVGPVGQEVVVEEGDYVTYPADRPHRWQAVGGDASLWIVHTFPRAASLSDT
ncbi:MAG TPA: XRE family transcriptional regulator [Aldersonia sp.]